MSKRLPVILARIFLSVGSLQKLALSLTVFALLTCMLSVRALAFDGNAPAQLQCEAMQEPLGIDITHPRLSWQMQDSIGAAPGRQHTKFEWQALPKHWRRTTPMFGTADGSTPISR